MKGSLYHYISAKEELLYRLLQQVHDDSEAILAAVEAEAAGTAGERSGPLAALESYVRRQVEYAASNLAKVSVYAEDTGYLSEAHAREIRSRLDRHERFVTERIAAAQRCGEVDPRLDTRVLANLLFTTVVGFYAWYRADPRVTPAELAEHCARYVLHGLAVPAAS